MYEAAPRCSKKPAGFKLATSYVRERELVSSSHPLDVPTLTNIKRSKGLSPHPTTPSEPSGAPRLSDGRFRNAVARRRQGVAEMLAMIWKAWTAKPKTAVPGAPLPVQPLAAAAEAAHRHGHVLGCDHPQRIRLNHDGRLQMGFALPRPELTPADDVRGLGAALYTLLTALWPLSPSGCRMSLSS